MMKKVDKDKFTIERGEVFQLKKPSVIVAVVSNGLHNLLSNYLIVILVTDKNVNQIQESLEVYFELKEKKLKMIASCFYTIDKKVFQESGIFLGKIDEKTAEKMDDKVRSILDL